MKMFLVFAALVLNGLAFGKDAPVDKPIAPPCCRKVVVAGAPTDRSLYQLESKWISDVGRTIKLGHLRGRPQIVAMFFSHCEYACPILVGQLKKLEAAMPQELKSNVDFLLVSFDSKRDTPKALADYRAKIRLSPERWTLLTGGAEDVRELAALLGINYQRDSRGQFSHSNLITVLNAEGEIVFQQTGLDTATDQLLSELNKLVPAR
jgi:protein SCO1/2